MKSNLFFFDCLCFDVTYKKLSPNTNTWKFIPMFSFKSFIVLALIFFGPFWVIFYIRHKTYVQFLLLSFIYFWPMDVSLLQHNLLCHLFSAELFLHLCQETVGHIYVGLFLSSLFCSIDLCVYLSSNIMLDRHSPISRELGTVPPTLLFLLKIF